MVRQTNDEKRSVEIRLPRQVITAPFNDKPAGDSIRKFNDEPAGDSPHSTVIALSSAGQNLDSGGVLVGSSGRKP